MLVKDGGRRGSARGANGVSGQMFSQLPSYGRKIWKNGNKFRQFHRQFYDSQQRHLMKGAAWNLSIWGSSR